MRSSSNRRSSSRIRSSTGSSSSSSKRQERVGQLVRTELAVILHSGRIPTPKSSRSSSSTNKKYPNQKGDPKDDLLSHTIDDDLRQRISIVSTNMSPDLRHARVCVSVRQRNTGTKLHSQPSPQLSHSEPEPLSSSEDHHYNHHNHDTIFDQRRAYSWLVHNQHLLKHALAQKLSHLKFCPSLTFVHVNVGAATDVMFLIDQLSRSHTTRKASSSSSSSSSFDVDVSAEAAYYANSLNDDDDYDDNSLNDDDDDQDTDWIELD